MLDIELVVRVYVILVFVVVCVQAEIRTVEDAILRWAPLIWLAPGEKYFPLSVEDFLKNVYPGAEPGKRADTLPTGRASESLYLITKKEIDYLRNTTSFLHGRNPQGNNVPIYVTLKECQANAPSSRWTDKHSPNDISYYSDSNPKLYFHVTYWMFYPYNEGKEVCFIGKVPAPFLFNRCLGTKKTMGNHIGDWEHVSLFFKGRWHPEEMYVSTHDAGVYYKYDRKSGLFKYKKQETRAGIVQRPKFPPVVRMSAGRPVLFAALGSHGLWSAPGEHYYARVLRLTDKTGYGIPWKTWKNLTIHDVDRDRPPVWMSFNGKWGNPKSNCLLFKKLGFCEFSDGPPGVLSRRQNFQCAMKDEDY